MLSFYESDEAHSPAEILAEGGKSKFYAIADLHDQHPDLFSKYAAVLFMDDDLIIKFDQIDLLFSKFEHYEMWLGQLALTHDSFRSWPITLCNPSFDVRFTNFVEVMAPIFSRDGLLRCIGTFRESVSSHGLDIIWAKILGNPERHVGIIDAVCIQHTKEIDIGTGKFYQYLRSIGIDAAAEFLAVLANHGMDRSALGHVRVLSAVTVDGVFLASALHETLDLATS